MACLVSVEFFGTNYLIVFSMQINGAIRSGSLTQVRKKIGWEPDGHYYQWLSTVTAHFYVSIVDTFFVPTLHMLLSNLAIS